MQYTATEAAFEALMSDAATNDFLKKSVLDNDPTVILESKIIDTLKYQPVAAEVISRLCKADVINTRAIAKTYELHRETFEKQMVGRKAEKGEEEE